MSSPGNWIRRFLNRSISRREFVERAAYGGLGISTTTAVLAAASGSHTQTDNFQLAAGDHQHTASVYANPDQTNDDAYGDWLNSENIPVISGYGVRNLRMVEVKPWARMGATGAHIRLIGTEGVDGAYVCEIPPGGSTKPQRYLFEEVIYVLAGEGETAIWTYSSDKQSVRWQAGSLLSPPLNTWRQHFNRGTGAARFISINNAPVVIDLFHNLEFVFNNEFAFRDRCDPGDFAAGSDSLYIKKVPPHPPVRNYGGTVVTPAQSGGGKGVQTWLNGFVPDARSLGLAQLTQRGVGNSRLELEMGDNTMQSHLSQFAVGTYKTAHRHGPGSHVLMLNGTGYTLMWFGPTKYSEADQKVRVDFGEASLVVPPDRWWHQHFNTGPEPARYLACTWGGDGRWFMEALGGGGRTHLLAKTSTRAGGNMIDYDDEDLVIREMYAGELERAGITMKMPSAR
jgi:quercetin dioxygenase-like cupin family protein